MRPDKEVFYKIAYSDIEKINYKNVLDLCCGTLNSIKHINKSERYIGVDAVKEVIEIARKRYPNSETYISKIEDNLGNEIEFEKLNYSAKDKLIKGKNVKLLDLENNLYNFIL